ncbi:hypothetical protein XELAEV_18036208mg [Xenopus laevis]|uniref:Uncharacterized protein n=1 Tax=Xenopus laevis TaxID=8355 RepID=A0A974CHG1_XENLA|nr:hypothetical protein XELAEV_18036208mg [Xenopus laevis]
MWRPYMDCVESVSTRAKSGTTALHCTFQPSTLDKGMIFGEPRIYCNNQPEGATSLETHRLRVPQYISQVSKALPSNIIYISSSQLSVCSCT